MSPARWLASGVVCLVGCADVAARSEAVVYGADDRTEVYAHASAVHRDLARNAIAMQVDGGWLDESDRSRVRVTYTQTLGEAQALCAGEPFADQIEPGTCSGTLIDDRHLLTAGHCVPTASDCDGASVWLFGFLYEAAGTLRTLSADDVYRCAHVVVGRDDAGGDYAVIALDRPVVGRTPARFRAAEVGMGEPLTMIGHPNGIPMKISGGARVVGLDGVFFFADTDSFSANSGSGVFTADGALAGILNAGAEDYVDRGGCNVVNVETVDSTGGETLTHAEVARAAFCATGTASSACGTGPDGGTLTDTARSDVPTIGRSDAASSADAGARAPVAGCACAAARPSPRAHTWLGAALLASIALRLRRRAAPRFA